MFKLDYFMTLHFLYTVQHHAILKEQQYMQQQGFNVMMTLNNL